MNITLCVIFNHPYSNNIPLIKDMLSGQFLNILFMQPFVPSNRDDVVVTYRGSYNFQGMMADAMPRLEAMKTDYVVFMQDDCLLNPRLNENNVLAEFQVSEDIPYFPQFAPIGGPIEAWYWTTPTIWRIVYNQCALHGTGVEDYSRYLPDGAKAKAHLELRYGLSFGPVSKARAGALHQYNALADPEGNKALTKTLVEGLFKTAPAEGIVLDFPWLCGMSDFSIMSIQSLRKIETFLRVTAAVNIFVEVAVPTAVALLHDQVSTADTTGWRVNYLWGNDREAVSVEGALSAFANHCAVLHPIKLSSQSVMAQEIIRRSGQSS